MKIDKSRRTHEFRGEDLAEPVLRYLRRDDRPADDKVERLVRLELERSRELLPGVSGPDRAQQIVEFVNETMRLWGPWPELGADLVPHDWTVSLKCGISGETSSDARLAFWNCLLLKQQGLLDRIRQCARPGCTEWFFGHYEHQTFHTDECRVASLSTDERHKEQRKKYMRDLRAKKKLKKLRGSKKGRKD